MEKILRIYFPNGNVPGQRASFTKIAKSQPRPKVGVSGVGNFRSDLYVTRQVTVTRKFVTRCTSESLKISF